jgi:hypothetical protein
MATARLRNSRKNWKLVSHSTRQLNEISAFISLIARTMCFQSSSTSSVDHASLPSSGTDRPTAPEIFQAKLGCCGYMYGIARSTAAMIHETCVLAEKILQFENIHSHDNQQLDTSLLADLLEQCESLGERLLSWKLLPEDVLSISLNGNDDDNDGPLMMTAFTHHAQAWHYAALVYYYRRIQRFDSANMTEEVNQIIDHMYAFETAKSQRRFPFNSYSPSYTCATATDTVRMAPITWPMFIASCEALPNKREKVRMWWVEAEGYQLANITRQWLVIQRIWATQDENRLKNVIGLSWMEIFSSLGVSLLPL